jgi:HrpA-like RNA helicase
MNTYLFKFLEFIYQVKLLDSNCSITSFLSKAIDPPNELSITNAIRLLQDIGALTSDEKLTELGKQLGALPVHPSTSKMLLLGILLNCLDPALTIACAAGFRDPFVLPTNSDQRKAAFAAKRDLSFAYGGYSDQLAIVAAYDHWEKAQSRGTAKKFCEQNFLSMGTMSMLSAMREQLRRELAVKGFLPHSCSLNANVPGIVRALLVAGSYPMVGMLLPAPAGKKAVVQTAQGMKVRIHPHSLNFKLVHVNSQKQEAANKPLLVFDEVTRGEAWMYIRNCTVVKPHPLVLLATEMVVAPCDTEDSDIDEDDLLSESSDDEDLPNEGKGEKIMSNPDSPVLVVLDRWLKFQTTALEASLIYCLRERLAAAIAFKVII